MGKKGQKEEKRKHLMYDVDATSIIEEGCSIGKGSVIWQFCHICEEAVIGQNVCIGQGVYIGPGVKIGHGCRIQNHVSIPEGVSLDINVYVGPGVVFTNIDLPRADKPQRNVFKSVKVQKGVTIQANATILQGVTLGKYCFVGAGFVVRNDVEAYRLLDGREESGKIWIAADGTAQTNRPGI